MVTVCNWQHASHNALTVKHDGSIGHSPMHLHRYWWFLIARSWGLFALVAHTMQDEYETHSCFSREASIETRECQSHELWILVNTTTNSYPRKNPDVNWQDNWHVRQLEHSTIQNHSAFFSTSTFWWTCAGHLRKSRPRVSQELLQVSGYFLVPYPQVPLEQFNKSTLTN